MKVGVEAPRTPTEVLIPEARQRQHRRYVRTGILLALAGLVLAALIAAAVALSGGAADGKSQTRPASVLSLHRSSPVYFRSVLCIAPPYNPTARVSAPAGPLACTASSALTGQNLNEQPQQNSPDGFTSNNVPPDASLAGVPSTRPSADKASATVLLPGIRGACDAAGYRCLLGAAEMSSALVRAATVTQTHQGAWVVEYTMKPADVALWDRVAEENFHQLLAIELDGTVYSAPIIQPTQSSFSTFGGKGEISGSLTKAQADRLAKGMVARSR